MFGKLTWSAVPFHDPIVMVTSAVVALAITAVLAWVIVKGHLPNIWKEWLSSVGPAPRVERAQALNSSRVTERTGKCMSEKPSPLKWADMPRKVPGSSARR